MGFEHNQFAYGANKLLLSQLRENRASWATPRLTVETGYWQGIADYPRPDGAFEDRSTGASLAIEFKPPGQIKREYVTGLGQTLTYLRTFEFAALIVPTKAGDGFAIAQYLQDNLNEPFASAIPIGLFAYERDPADETDLKSLVDLRPRTDPPEIPRGVGRSVFWGYWRDLSQYDVLSILTAIDAHAGASFDDAYTYFWNNFMTTGRALTWEGNSRKPKQAGAASYNSEKINAFYSLRHIGLINSDGTLTESGYQLLRLGKIYGALSVAFERYLASQILDVGRHLELIFWVDEQQRTISRDAKGSAQEFNRELNMALEIAHVIPAAPQGAKAAFLRDEMKLWNKLKLLVPYTSNSYFHPNEGLIFNWRNIVATASS